jgi:hypothetical protein
MCATSITASRPRLLFLSINDGSDTRINKEIVTLSREFDIDFVGISESVTRPFIADHVRKLVLARGRRRSILTLMHWWWNVFLLRCRNRYATIHVINENLLLLLWPLLLGQSVVLDIFDSMFLKSSFPGWLRRLGQRICYSLPKKILVTDEARSELMPEYVRPKLLIIPNYPFRYTGELLARDPSVIRILYAGSLVERRGTEFIAQLLAASTDIHVVMAGWIRDQSTQALTTLPRVEWLGVIPQQEIIRQASRCDFILCHYEPSSQNNIYASPNKIYDAIQAGVAVIINPEIRVSGFVREHHLGVVLDAFEPDDIQAVIQSLRDFKASFRPDPALRTQFIWDSIEGLLLSAHDCPA